MKQVTGQCVMKKSLKKKTKKLYSTLIQVTHTTSTVRTLEEIQRGNQMKLAVELYTNQIVIEQIQLTGGFSFETWLMTLDNTQKNYIQNGY